MWIAIKKKIPRAGRFIIFCEKTKLKTVHLGWFERGKYHIDKQDAWFSDSSGKWFHTEEILAWFSIPKCKFHLAQSLYGKGI